MAQEIEALKAEVAALKDQSLRVVRPRRRTPSAAVWRRDANDARAYAIQKFARDLLDAVRQPVTAPSSTHPRTPSDPHGEANLRPRHRP